MTAAGSWLQRCTPADVAQLVAVLQAGLGTSDGAVAGATLHAACYEGRPVDIDFNSTSGSIWDLNVGLLGDATEGGVVSMWQATCHQGRGRVTNTAVLAYFNADTDLRHRAASLDDHTVHQAHAALQPDGPPDLPSI